MPTRHISFVGLLACIAACPFGVGSSVEGAPCETDRDGDGRGPGCRQGEDCDDDDPERWRLATLYPDNDGDGGFAPEGEEACIGDEPPAGFADVEPEAFDCDDDDPTRSPTIPEACDAFDNDCDGVPDQGDACPCVTLFRAGVSHPYLRCNARLPWAEICTGLPGYRPVIVDDQAEADFIAAMGSAFWIGLSDVETEGEFVWIDGTPMTFDGFAPGEPNSQYEDEDCVEAHAGGWNDRHCQRARRAICESDPALRDVSGVGCVDDDGDGRGAGCTLGPDCDDGDATAWAVRAGFPDEDGDGATATVPIPLCVGDVSPPGFLPPQSGADCDDRDPEVQDGCPCEVRYTGDKRYHFCTDGLTWDKARERCEDELGLTLVKIDDPAELTALGEHAGFLGGAYWIGLTDIDQEGAFTWASDGSPMAFDAFRPGEPNNLGGDEDCVELVDGLWNDANCAETRFFICE